MTMTGMRSDSAGQTDQSVLLIRLADEVYALPSSYVREVGRYRAFTPVPGAPSTIPGIIQPAWRYPAGSRSAPGARPANC
ncbi:MAG: chemotaxis protein CheW [Roseiflexaceae bacterium]|nr:chemotaxis protein CheW [Roseiflexaceae bacterium]